MTPADLSILRQSIKNEEGLRLLPYDDATGSPLKIGDVLKGVLTIGWGRAIGVSGINQLEAEAMLDQDIARHVSDLLRAFPYVAKFDSTRQIVLANMAFNLGVPRLSTFVQMWYALQRNDFHTAALEMLNSMWAQQVGARATRLAAAMDSGELKV